LLSKEELAARRRGIGGSDARRIMDGDWLNLYLEKIGEKEEEYDEFAIPPNIGHATEAFNRKLTGHKINLPIEGPCVTIAHPIETHMLCHLDGRGRHPVKGPFAAEFKHVNQFAKKDGVEHQVERYYWQLQHNLFVGGFRHLIFGVFFGTLDHDIIWVEPDTPKLNELLDAEREFWDHVERRKPPSPRGEFADVGSLPRIEKEAMREVAMHTSNHLGVLAAAWLEKRQPAKDFEDAAKEIKGLVEPDVCRIYGHGIQVTRSKAGALTIAPYKSKKGDVPPPAIAAE
jgi:predicted phage-related endonuclease